jgi:hypothetical protein
MTYRDLITDSLVEINAYGPGETPQDRDFEVGKSQLNYMLDEWAARKVYAYNQNFNLYTLTANLQPHTIGPTGVFVVDQRPVRIENAAIVLNASTSPVDVPLNIRDDDWWAGQSVKEITSTVPTDLYYSPAWPNGQLYLWPIPSSANGLRLETWQLISQVSNVSASLSLPPGYKLAMMASLAEMLCGPFERPFPTGLQMKAMNARKAIQGNNDQSKRISTYDVGMPGGLRRGDFNYKTGIRAPNEVWPHRKFVFGAIP